MFSDWLYNFSVWVLPVSTAITMHEAAHGYVAFKLGDDTAKKLGRVSLNPFKHIDILGTIIIPAILLLTQLSFLFGWAKPVPVCFNKLRVPNRDMIFVAFSGPAINLIIAFFCGFMLHIVNIMPNTIENWLIENLQNAIFINIMLCVFNMLPIPPLDGGRIVVGLLPEPFSSYLSRLERFGILIVLFIFIILPWLFSVIGLNLYPAKWLLYEPVGFLFEIIGYFAGN